MNDLEKCFYANTGRVIHKGRHYFEVYDRHFARFHNAPVHVVEIGVDIDPNCRQCAEDRVEILIGSQEDRNFLKSVIRAVPKIDILLDDGGETMNQQIATFEEPYPRIDLNGVYLCEDPHTSYRGDYGDDYQRRDSCVEYSKQLIDRLNGWHSREPGWLDVTDFTRTTYSMHYYDSVLAIEKGPLEAPSHLMTGSP